MKGSLIRRRAFDTFLAAKLKAQHRRSSVFRLHPFTLDQRWIISDMLVVAAIKMRDPMAFVVGVIADDRSRKCFADNFHQDALSQSGMIGLAESTSCWIVTLANAFSVAAYARSSSA